MLKTVSLANGLSVILTAAFACLAPAADLRISGSNSWGQLGMGEVSWTTRFIKITEDVLDVEAGTDHILFKDTNQQLWGLGGSAAGQLGPQYFAENQLFTTIPVLLSENVDHFHAGEYWSFFATTDGPLLASGSARQIEIGYWNGRSNRYKFKSVFGLDNISKVATYFLQGLFLKEDGTLYGTGYAFSVGKEDGINADVPFHIADDVIDIATGGYKSFYLNQNRDLYEVTRYPYPGLIAENVQSFSHGGQALFTVVDGDLFVQGQSNEGALGLGKEITQTSPHSLVAEGVLRVVASAQNAFFLKEDASLWGMGSNEYGQLATGDFSPRFTPTLIHPNVSDFAANATTLYIVDSQNDLHFSGKKDYPTGHKREFPTLVPSIVMNDVRDATVGHEAVFMITEDDSLWAIGKNDKGQLGTGDQLHALAPQKTLNHVESVSANLNHTLYLQKNGQLLGSGSDEHGALGFPDRLTTDPKIIEDGVIQATAAVAATLFIKTDKTLWRLGDPQVSTTDPQSYETDTQKSLIANDTESVSGDISTFYVTTEKTLWGTGSSILSQFNAHTTETLEEGPILIDQDVRKLSAKSNTVAYVKTDNTLWVFGNTYYLRENQDGSSFRSTPEFLDDDVIHVKHGIGSLIYQKVDGSVWKIGYNRFIASHVNGEDAQTPHQIWANAPIEHFDYSGSNISYLTGPIAAPSTPLINLSSDGKTALGDSIVLTGSANGDFLHYQWYRGQLGDRTHPIETRGRPDLTIHPYTERTYWLEVTNDTGSAMVSETVTPQVQFPAYGKWASENDLFYPYGFFAADEDGDSNPNLLEFAFGLDPRKYDTAPVSITVQEATGALQLELPEPSNEDLHLKILYRLLGGIDWQEFVEPLPNVEAGIRTVELPNSVIGKGLMLKIEIQPPAID